VMPSSSDDIYRESAADIYDECPAPCYGPLASFITSHPFIQRVHYDVGCGTGSLVNLLNADGWKSDGCDPSTSMVAKARLKNDKCSIQIGSCCDYQPSSDCTLITATNDVINHLGSANELRLFIKRTYEFLSVDGFLIFDTVTPQDIRNNWNGYIQIDKRERYTLVRTGSVLSDYQGLLRYDFYCHDVNRKMWTVETEEHVVTTYELPMLIDILEETGFHSIRIVDHESLMPPDHDCVRWLLSARK
jgi:SAM-dependent methyltransferase